MCTKSKFSTRPDPNLNFSSPTRPDPTIFQPDPTRPDDISTRPDPTGFQPDPTRPDIFISCNFSKNFPFGTRNALTS